ncbi:MAG: protein-export membrane protein SecD [SAR202 cluster bacterium Io17-Chloro-G9]|nr:MAG: protein-export membrane protein SecD [SAR202 cluster bacterium Io17-Chloro-G9]
MRARSIRLSILILFILSVSLATLAFKDIHIDIPGFPEVNRGGGGPLGLKLGLDLRGGGHLVYQADTGTRFVATFVDPISPSEVEEALTDLPFGAEELTLPEFTVEPRDPATVLIKTDLLDGSDPRRTDFQETVEAKLGTIDNLSITVVDLPTPDQMQGVLDTINRRVNLFGTEEPIIQRFGEDRIIVQLPGASGSITEILFSEEAAREDLLDILTAANLENVSIASSDNLNYKISSDTLGAVKQEELLGLMEDRFGPILLFQVVSGIDEAKNLIGLTARLEFKERTCLTPITCDQFTDSDIGLTGDDLADSFHSTDQLGQWVVNLQFNGRGEDIFSELTQRIYQQQDTKRIAIFLDDQEILAPVALAWIRDGRTQISGSFSREEARLFSIQLDSGRLPVPLKLIQESDVDALLGAESLRNSLLAGFVGLGLVFAFMIAYYRMAGVVAAAALIFYTIVMLAVLKMIPITVTLSHVGGFILSIGMAVDANILIFERMKEEVRIGRTLASSMEVGFSRAWPAIRDGNFSTLITCGVLLWFGDRLGGGLITGFAISLGIGVLVSMFTAVVVSRNLLQLLAWIGLGGRISLFTPEPRPGTQAAGGSS